MHTYIHTPPYFMHPDTIKCEHSFNMMQTQTQILQDIIKWLPFYCKHGLFSFFSFGWLGFFSPFHFFSAILGFSFWHSYSFGCEYPLHCHNHIKFECLKFSSSFLITDIFTKVGVFFLPFDFASHSGIRIPS